MTKIISSEWLKKHICECQAHLPTRRAMLDYVDQAPSVELDEDTIQEYLNPRCMTIVSNDVLRHMQIQRTGHWRPTHKRYTLKDNDNTFVGEYYKCSECGFDESRGGKYCLSCGALMTYVNE